MQQHIYAAQKKKIISQSFPIWFFVSLQIFINVLFAPILSEHGPRLFIVFINLILSTLTIPSIIVFFEYYKYSVGKKFIVTYDSVKMIDEKTNEATELINSDINKIGLVENKRASRLPWMFHNYFYFTDTKNNKIIVTSYFMNLGDFWQDTLTRKIDSNKLIREEKMLPLFNR